MTKEALVSLYACLTRSETRPHWNGWCQSSLDGGRVCWAALLETCLSRIGAAFWNLMGSCIRDSGRGHWREGAPPAALHYEGAGGGNGESLWPLGSAGHPSCRDQDLEEAPSLHEPGLERQHSARVDCMLEKAAPYRALALEKRQSARVEHLVKLYAAGSWPATSTGTREEKKSFLLLPPTTRFNIMPSGKGEILTDYLHDHIASNEG